MTRSAEGYPPEGAYRGITSSGCFTDEEQTIVSIDAFLFSDEHRDDGAEECSINWIDDDGSLVRLARQTKPDPDDPTRRIPHFQGGACSLPLSELDFIKRSCAGYFSYERRPVQAEDSDDGLENPYHGNLLLTTTGSKQAKRNQKRQAQTLLAHEASRPGVISRAQLDSLL